MGFKTCAVWQPHARSVGLRRRSVEPKLACRRGFRRSTPPPHTETGKPLETARSRPGQWLTVARMWREIHGESRPRRHPSANRSPPPAVSVPQPRAPGQDQATGRHQPSSRAADGRDTLAYVSTSTRSQGGQERDGLGCGVHALATRTARWRHGGRDTRKAPHGGPSFPSRDVPYRAVIVSLRAVGPVVWGVPTNGAAADDVSPVVENGYMPPPSVAVFPVTSVSVRTRLLSCDL